MANNPQLVKPTTDGTLQLYPTNCEIYGPTIVMERLYKNLGKWQSENDRAVWNVELPKAGPLCDVAQLCLPGRERRQHLAAGGRRQDAHRKSRGDRQHRSLPGNSRAARSTCPPARSKSCFRSAGPIKGSLLQLGGMLLKPATATAKIAIDGASDDYPRFALPAPAFASSAFACVASSRPCDRRSRRSAARRAWLR